MYKQALEKDLKTAVKELGFITTDIVLSISENSKFGDYTSNIALQLSKQAKGKNYQSPSEIASKILDQLGHPSYLERVEVAGAGFINFFLKDEFLIKSLDTKTEEKDKKQPKKRILLEYADPNTHKALHIGHLRTLIYGESLARLFEYTGMQVFRVNYGSDIGPTVAKALWGVMKLNDKYAQVKQESLRVKAEFLGEAYAYAHSQYEQDPKVKNQIDQLNQQIYQRDAGILPLWDETKRWSLGYFDTIFSRMNTEFDLRVNESEIDEAGKRIVKEHIGPIFVEDQGAVIFPGEKYGLHNRVFLTGKGHPTYEGKEVGLVERYQEVFPFDEAIILSDITQAGFFEVVNKAIELVYPHLLGRKKYLGYGFVALTSGKMSSRKGNIISGDELIDQVVSLVKGGKDVQEKIALAAVKFYYLKYGISSDIVYDVEKSVALQGDTGIYVLYTYVRTVSLLIKALSASKNQELKTQNSLELEEREILRLLEYFDIVVEHAASEYSPNYLSEYLLNLSRAFNLIYEKYPIVGSTSQDFRLKLTTRVGETLKLGLYLMGIETVEKM